MSFGRDELKRLHDQDPSLAHNSFVDRGWGFWRPIGYFGKILEAPLVDMSPLASGAIAGMTGRTVVAITDKMFITEPKSPKVHGLDTMPDNRDLVTRIRRRGMLYGVFFWMYISMHRRAQFDDDWHTESLRVRDRIRKSVMLSGAAAITARLLVNVWTNISDAAKAKYMSRKIAFKYLTKHDSLPGMWAIFVGQPPALAAMVYHGGTIFLFEATRRFIRGVEPHDVDLHHRTHPGSIVATALFNGTLAAGCATLVSAATYRFSKPYYRNEISRPNALNRLPFDFVVRREALMVGVTYGVFSLLQPFLSPHHSRCGFGY